MNMSHSHCPIACIGYSKKWRNAPIFWSAGLKLLPNKAVTFKKLIKGKATSPVKPFPGSLQVTGFYELFFGMIPSFSSFWIPCYKYMLLAIIQNSN